MNHYQQQYYAPPPPAAPIQSSFYAARQRFEQQPQISSVPPHLRSNACDYQQQTAPPRHPLQQERLGGQQQSGPAGPSQGRPQPQTQQFARTRPQYGQVQQYQPPYAQSQVQAAQSQPPYTPSGQYTPHSKFNPAQYTQRMHGYPPPMPMQPQILPQPSPAQAFAMYEAYNARTQRAAKQQQHHEQPQSPQAQFGRPVIVPHIAPLTSAPPGSQPHPPLPETSAPNGSRRPLPQPGQQARPRPLSMPPQTQQQVQIPQNGHGHSSSTSLLHVMPQSSAGSGSPLPSDSSAFVSMSPSKDIPQIMNAQFRRTTTPEKVPEVSPTGETTAQRTPTQRRALPHSPTAPPDLTQLRHCRSGLFPTSSPQSHAKSVISNPTQQTPQQASPQPRLSSDSEDDDRLSAVSQGDKEGGTQTLSPQYGILDLPERNSRVLDAKPDPPSPQYGIKDLPARTKSVVDRRKAWERAEQGMNEALTRSKSDSPTKQSSSTSVHCAPPPALARSPQPQTPQQPQLLPMPIVRQPQPSRTERTPSWTYPTADLEKITVGNEQKTSMALRFATMTLEEQNSKMKTRTVSPATRAEHSVTQRNSKSRSESPTKSHSFSTRNPRRSVNMDLSLDDAPPPSLRCSPSTSASTASSSVPSIKTPEDVRQQGSLQNSVPAIPQISLPGDLDLDDVVNSVPNVQVQAPIISVLPKSASPRKASIPMINVRDDEGVISSSETTISVSAPSPQTHAVPMPIILDDLASSASQTKSRGLPRAPSAAVPVPASSSSGSNLRSRGGGLVCGGCHQGIVGRIVSAMGLRWHPQCFKCSTCGEYLEHVSSYEHDGKPYCHLDYHELFAPKCYSCKTPIIDERFITLDDPALGKRTYHEQHFFCAECGDPFLTPSSAKQSSRSGRNEINIKGDGAFDVALDEDGEEVGFTVFRGHPYCEACHVRLRAPKCKACKKSIREGMRAVEALGGKWCYECFVCSSCQRPFEEPSFFQRDKQPFCEHCFSVILRNEL